MRSWGRLGEGKGSGRILNEAGRTRGQWQSFGSVRVRVFWEKQNPPSHTSTTQTDADNHTSTTQTDAETKGRPWLLPRIQNTDIYQIKCRICYIDQGNSHLKARGLGHIGVTLNLFYFPRRTIGIPRNPTGFQLFGPIPSAQSLQLSPSQRTDCSPITSPDVVEPHVSPWFWSSCREPEHY